MPGVDVERAIIVHGKPTQERYENPRLPKPHRANWLPWVGQQLTAQGVTVDIPAMPEPYAPDYQKWLSKIDPFDISPGTALIGHSTGAEFILRMLSQDLKDSTVGPVILVAPWRDDSGKYGDFSDYELDDNLVARTQGLTIMVSSNDTQRIQDRAYGLESQLPGAELMCFSSFGHFMTGNAMPGPEFPELLRVLSATQTE
jgi:predicted alpha/beta hydrolase family esterase